MIVVLDGSHVNGQLKRWLRGHTNWWFSTELCNVNFADLVAIKRNKICQYFLDHTEFEYLLMMDADMLPEEETDKIFEAPGDVVSCPYLGSNGKPSHFGFSNGSTGAGCLRISRRALRAIPKPWFKMEISDDGLQWQLCECGYFSEKAKHYGFNPIKCGRIGHKVPVLASLKQEDGKARAELRFGGSDGGYDHG